MEELRRVYAPILKLGWEVSAEDVSCDGCNLKGGLMALEEPAISVDRAMLGGSRPFIKFSARKRLCDRKRN